MEGWVVGDGCWVHDYFHSPLDRLGRIYFPFLRSWSIFYFIRCPMLEVELTVFRGETQYLKHHQAIVKDYSVLLFKGQLTAVVSTAVVSKHVNMMSTCQHLQRAAGLFDVAVTNLNFAAIVPDETEQNGTNRVPTHTETFEGARNIIVQHFHCVEHTHIP